MICLKKKLLLFANKLIEKIPDPCNAKKHYQSFIREKNKKSAKQSEIITNELKTFENQSISVIKEHPKNSHKLSKTLKKVKKLGFNSSLYSYTKKVKTF